MKMPRRVHRRLLLPPGWVALGFLLLLGCQALQPWQKRIKLWNVLQVTMPALHLDKNAYRNEVIYQSPTQLNKLRPWYDITFQGKQLLDFLNAANAESAVLKNIADSSHAGGVRIRFLPGATYGNLVKALDIMNYTNQKKYWLDIHHQPVMLYAITEEQNPQKHGTMPVYLGCCTCGFEMPILDNKPVWLTEIKSLTQRSWRAPMLVFFLISSLSAMQLFRPKLGRSNF
jgi:hypothetical protein